MSRGMIAAAMGLCFVAMIVCSVLLYGFRVDNAVVRYGPIPLFVAVLVLHRLWKSKSR